MSKDKKPAFRLTFDFPVGVSRERAEEIFDSVEEFMANGHGVMPLQSSCLSERQPIRLRRPSKVK